jgi:hypothetical protein
MKRTLLLTIVVFMTLSAAGQESDRQVRMNPSERSARKMQTREFLPSQSPATLQHHVRSLPAFKERTKSKGIYLMQMDSVLVNTYDYLSGLLKPDNKSEFSYDQDGNLSKETSYTWDPDENIWVPDWEEVFSFSDDGDIILLSGYKWDDLTEDWLPEYIEEFLYDDQGNMIRITVSDRDHDENSWVYQWKDEYIYDEQGRVIREYAYSYEIWDELWYEDWMTEYIYDEHGNVVMIVFYDWDWEDLEDWVPDVRYRQIFDENNYLVEGYHEEWNPEDEEWEIYLKMEYEINQDGKVASILHYEPGDTEDDLIPVTRIVNTYDNNLNLVNQTTYYLEDEEEDPEWIPASRIEYIVDDSYTADQVLSPFYLYGLFEIVDMLIEINDYYYDDGEWLAFNNIGLFYSEYEPGDEPDSYVLTITIDGNGTVVVDGEPYSGPVTAESGTWIDLEAIPDDGNEFVEWQGDIQSEEAQISVQMDGNTSITALFSIVSHIPEIDAEDTYVYPNPFRDNITITNPGYLSRVAISNIAGQIITEVPITGQGEIIIPTSEMEDGVYLIILQTRNGNRIIRKAVKN